MGCNADREYVDRLLKPQTPLALPAKSERRLRVLTYRWHCPHQYELYKLDHDFALISDLGTGFTDQWDYAQRPLRPNARVVALDQVDLRDFDFALLHFDENVLATHNTNGVIGQDWSASFKWAMQNLDMPKVAICHGTPQFYGQYDANYAWGDLGVVIEEERRRLVDYLDDLSLIHI